MQATEGEKSVFKGNISNPTDFVVAIGGYKWNVHSNVLSNQSEFFRKICNGTFKESKDRIVVLHDDCPWIVASMLLWLYSICFLPYDDYPDEEDEEGLEGMMKRGEKFSDFKKVREVHRNREEWQIYGLLYQLADKYEIPELKQDCADFMAQALADDLTLFVRMNEFILDNSIILAKDIYEEALAYAWRRHSAHEVLEQWTLAFGTDHEMLRLLNMAMADHLDGAVSESLKTMSQAIRESGDILWDGRCRPTKERLWRIHGSICTARSFLAE